MVDLRQIGGSIAGLLMVAVRSFLLTLLVMLLLGIVLAIASYAILSSLHWGYAVIAAVVALIECVVVGFFLAGKRAIADTLVHGLRTFQIGSSAVQLVFGRLLGVSAAALHGERGGRLAQTAERLPLALAEKRLEDAVQSLVSTPSEGGGLSGWLRRRVQNRLLGIIHKVTLARFREEDAQHGGVDLVKVQNELGEQIDGFLTGKLRGGMNLWTAVVLLGLPVQIVVMNYIVLAFMK